MKGIVQKIDAATICAIFLIMKTFQQYRQIKKFCLCVHGNSYFTLFFTCGNFTVHRLHSSLLRHAMNVWINVPISTVVGGGKRQYVYRRKFS